MSAQNSKSIDLLNKVYDHLDSIDISKLSMSELKDFLEVVQKGQFLESYEKGFQNGFGVYGMCNPNSVGGATPTTVEGSETE